MKNYGSVDKLQGQMKNYGSRINSKVQMKNYGSGDKHQNSNKNYGSGDKLQSSNEKKHQGLNEQLTRFKISMVQRINKSFSDKIHSSGGILQLVKILWLGC